MHRMPSPAPFGNGSGNRLRRSGSLPTGSRGLRPSGLSTTQGASSCRRLSNHDDVTIRDVPPTPVAIMEHRGDPATLGATIQRFIAWRKAAGLSPRDKSDLQCLAFRSGVPPRRPITAWTFVSGPTSRSRRTASRSKPARSLADAARCCAIVGNTNNLEPAALYLYRDWLPASGEEARDFPIYCQRQLPLPGGAGA